jgi:predicted ferric reductase
VLLAATLPVGLLFGRRLVGRRWRPDVRTAHMTLSICALAVTSLHIVTLLGATRLGADAARLVVPTLWPYRRTATALGVASAYALALLGPTYYVRRTVGPRRWRIAHRFVAAGLVLAILHVVGGG